MNNDRIYSISNRAMLVITLITLVLVPGTLFFGSVTTQPNEATFAPIAVIAWMALYIYVGYGWVFGYKSKPVKFSD